MYGIGLRASGWSSEKVMRAENRNSAEWQNRRTTMNEYFQRTARVLGFG